MTGFDLNIGAQVHCKDGQCGRLLKVIVDPHTRQVTDLIVGKGRLLKTDKVLPVSLVEISTEKEIRLSVTADQLEDYAPYRKVEFSGVPSPDFQPGGGSEAGERLARHRSRGGADILAEVQDRLQAAYLNGVKVVLDNGVVRLTGIVPDVTAIRQAEAIAASVQGVLGVENALDTGAIGGSRVVAALTKDSQADIALVEVSDEEGVLTLEGQVGSQEIRETLEEVAEERTDVHTVISELEVKPDEGSTL